MIFRIIDSALNPATSCNEGTLQDGFFLFLVKATELGESKVASTFKDFWNKTGSAGDTGIALGFAKPGDGELAKIDSPENQEFSKKALGDSLSRVAIAGSSAFAEDIMKWVVNGKAKVDQRAAQNVAMGLR